MTRLVIQGLELRGRHGVSAEERARAQPFAIDLELELEGEFGSTDELEATVDYTKVIERVKEINERSFKLIEAFASAVAEAILAGFPKVGRVTVRVRKLHPPLPPRTRVGWLGAEVVVERR
jgi:dihydroneopterin aldolase